MLEMEICIKMKLVFRILLLLTPFIGLGCSDSEPEFSEEDLPNRTILVYLAAENSLSSFALDDYDEMLLGMESVSEKNHLLVYVDVNKDKQGNTALPQLIHIGKNARTGLVEETLVYEYPEQDASSVTVERMTDVFQRGTDDGRIPAGFFSLSGEELRTGPLVARRWLVACFEIASFVWSGWWQQWPANGYLGLGRGSGKRCGVFGKSFRF